MGALLNFDDTASADTPSNNSNYKGTSKTLDYKSQPDYKNMKAPIPSKTPKSLFGGMLSKLAGKSLVGMLGLDYILQPIIDATKSKYAEMGYTDKPTSSSPGESNLPSASPKEKLSESVSKVKEIESMHNENSGSSSDSSSDTDSENKPDTLISVLKASAEASKSIATQLSVQNTILITNHKEILEAQQLAIDVDVAYKELAISNSEGKKNKDEIIDDLKDEVLKLKRDIDDILVDEQLNSKDYDHYISPEDFKATIDRMSLLKVSFDINPLVTKMGEISNSVDSLANSKSASKTSLDSIKKVLNDGITIKKTKSEEELLTANLEKVKFETTPIKLDNVEDIPEATPQHLEALKNAVVAKKVSDENTFELDDDDYDDLFDPLANVDISEMFKFENKSVRLSDAGLTEFKIKNDEEE